MQGFTEGRPSSPGGLSASFTWKAGPITAYEVMGPLPAGRVLMHLWWRLQTLSGTSVRHTVGFVLSGSPSATAENFRSGQSLLVGRGSSLEGQPTVEMLLNSRQGFSGFMYPGVELRSGSQWLIVGSQVSPSGNRTLQVSVQFVWPGWYGGQFASLPVPPAEPEE